MKNKIKIKLKEPDQTLQNTYLCSVSNDNKYNLQNITCNSKIAIKLKTEIWVPIVNHEKLYEISNFGNIKSLSTNKIMIKSKDPDNYESIKLIDNQGKRKKFSVHRLDRGTWQGNSGRRCVCY